MTACAKGEVCELEFSAAARRNGFKVFLPVGHAGSVDVVVLTDGGRPKTVQVKLANHEEDYGKHRARKTTPLITGGRYKCCLRKRGREGSRAYGETDFDILAVLMPNHGFVFFPVCKVSGSKSLVWYPEKSEPRPWNWEVFSE